MCITKLYSGKKLGLDVQTVNVICQLLLLSG